MISPDLSNLIERCRKGAGPDRGIGRAIAKHFKLGWDYGADWPTVIGDDGKKTSEPTAYPYTASIDSITALIEQKLPGFVYGFDNGPKTHLAFVDRHDHAVRFLGARWTAEAPTLPLALCLAFLLAIHSQDTDHE